MQFKRNIGAIDRVLRSGIGAMMLYFGFFNQILISDAVARMALGTMGVFMLFIAFIGICPMYALIGFSTVSPKADSTH